MGGLSRRQLSIITATALSAAVVLVVMFVHEIRTRDYFDLVPLTFLTFVLGVASFLYIRRSVAMVELRESEDRYRLIVDNATDAIFITTRDGRYLDVNEAAARLTGYSRDELLQLSPFDLAVPEEHDSVRERIRRAAAGETIRAERHIKRKDGTTIMAELSASRLDDQRLISICRDITSRQEAHEALESREQLFHAVSEMTSDYAWSMHVMPDASLEWEWVTDGFQRMFGLSPQEMQDRGGWESMFHPDDLPRARETFARLFAEPVSISDEYRMLRADGSVVEIRSWIGAVRDEQDRPIKLFGAIQDITDIKSAEEELRRSEELFRAISELTSDYVYSMIVEADGSLEPDWFSGAYERVTGYTTEESHARGGWTALVHPDDVPRLAEGFQETLTDPAAPSSESEFRIVAKSGDIRHVRAWVQPVWDDAQNRVVRIYGAVSDITEAKRLEENLRESQAKFEDLYQRLPVGIYQRTWDGRGVDANPACAEILGYPDVPTFIKAMPEDFYVDLRDRDVWLGLLDTHEVVKNFEVQLRRHDDGSVIWVRNTGRVVRDENGNISFFEGAIQDITEQKRIEEQLRFALSTLQRTDDERRRLLTHLVRAKEDERNRVASDIHDDSVQVMTSVAISLERLARRVSDTDERRALAELEDSVRAAIGRLRKMVFELRPPALDEEGLVPALRLYLEEFKLDTGIDYRFVSEPSEEPTSQTRVVLYRIAQEALTNVRKHSGATRVSVTLARANGGVSLTIADDGVGFSADEIDHVPGHIGLSEMRERAEMAGGKLELDTGPGAGATVTVWVPEAVEAVR